MEKQSIYQVVNKEMGSAIYSLVKREFPDIRFDETLVRVCIKSLFKSEEDRTPSLWLNKEMGTYNDFSTGKKGRYISLYIEIQKAKYGRDISPKDAIKEIVRDNPFLQFVINTLVQGKKEEEKTLEFPVKTYSPKKVAKKYNFQQLIKAMLANNNSSGLMSIINDYQNGLTFERIVENNKGYLDMGKMQDNTALEDFFNSVMEGK